MQAYEVQFLPAQRPPLHINDAIPAETLPFPHVSVGDPATPGKGARVPLTSRLTASFNQGPSMICRAKAYRDPKTGSVVLGAVDPEARGQALQRGGESGLRGAEVALCVQ